MPDNGQRLNIKVSDEILGGTYANEVLIWHTQKEFTLDFLVVPSMPSPYPEADGATEIPGQHVARLKIPLSTIFEIAKAISNNIGVYEESYGALTPQPEDDPRGGTL
ncbi:DUF3467 domain-containing protein [Candidatus Poriferisocius sp.]|uniref:DUF3467 domain-containing protein n=1 Tax=Candidatus Poriferisocius sp. TaxID=3101276 RepID=UPI003B01968C